MSMNNTELGVVFAIISTIGGHSQMIKMSYIMLKVLGWNF